MASTNIIQISKNIFCREDIFNLHMPTRRLPNSYAEEPFLMIDGFLSSVECQEIVKSIETSDDAVEAKLRSNKSIKVEETLNESIRKTKIYELNEELKTHYIEAFEKHKECIERFFNVSLFDATHIQVLEYTEGGFYKSHSDDSNMMMMDGELIGFKLVAPERIVTTVLFLNDDFEGGELRFNYLLHKEGQEVVLKPKEGRLVIFLSNPVFTHEVKVVNRGRRMTLVQWHNSIN